MQQQETLHQVGAFEPYEAKRLLARFEAEGIPFELEAGHSALARPGRWMHQYFGMYPEGSKLLLFVSESWVDRAEAIVREMFPV